MSYYAMLYLYLLLVLVLYLYLYLYIDIDIDIRKKDIITYIIIYYLLIVNT